VVKTLRWWRSLQTRYNRHQWFWAFEETRQKRWALFCDKKQAFYLEVSMAYYSAPNFKYVVDKNDNDKPDKLRVNGLGYFDQLLFLLLIFLINRQKWVFIDNWFFLHLFWWQLWPIEKMGGGRRDFWRWENFGCRWTKDFLSMMCASINFFEGFSNRTTVLNHTLNDMKYVIETRGYAIDDDSHAAIWSVTGPCFVLAGMRRWGRMKSILFHSAHLFIQCVAVDSIR
jgi:hypothetical protein